MTDNFEHRSAAELFRAAIRKAFEKKRTGVITSLIMLPAAVFCIRELHSGWHFLNGTWFSYLLTVLLFAVVTLSGGVLVSSIGSFKRWKFYTGASVSGVLLWGAVTFLSVYTGLEIAVYAESAFYIAELLKYTVPMLLIALLLTVLVEIFFTREKRRS